jgi:hypothetical protein
MEGVHSDGTAENLHARIPATLLAEAQQVAVADRISMDDLVREAMERRLMERRQEDGGSNPELMSPEEWLQRFTAWSESAVHANLPDLSDEAMSRESIYEDRGL